MRGSRGYYVAVFLVAGQIAWALWEFVFRHYGAGQPTGSLLDASPGAAVAAAIVWVLATVVLSGVGVLLVRLVR